MLFLILGDMSAAIIGVSFGGETCTMRLGRQGKKSLEGSLAMFAVCFATCCSVFLSVGRGAWTPPRSGPRHRGWLA